MASASPPGTFPRLDAITGLRWWAAFAVFFYHVRNVVPISGPLAALAPFGYYGVTFFFVLSGFVLTWSWRQEVDKRTFYWRRFARIYPLHIVTLLLALPVFYSFAADPQPPWVKTVDWGAIALSVVLLQGWFRNPAVQFAGNPASWTLTVEAFFYAVHPFVTSGLRRMSRRGALIAAAVVLVVAFVVRAALIVDPDGWLSYVPMPVMRLNEFVLGMCLAWALREGWRPRIPLLVPVGLIAAWCGLLVVTGHVASLGGISAVVAPFGAEMATALLALLILSVALHELSGRARWLRTRPLVALGEWSYAFYLIHATVLYGVSRLHGPVSGGWPAVLWFIVILAISITLAWALHVGIERPVERRLRAWQTRRRQNAGGRASRPDASTPLPSDGSHR